MTYPPGLPPAFPYGAPQQPQRNGAGTAALVFGVVALLLSCTIIGGIGGGLVALVLGIVGARRAGRGEADNRGVAIGGLVLGALSLLLGAGVLGYSLYLYSSMGMGDYINCVQAAHNDQDKVNECTKAFNQRVNEYFGTNTDLGTPPPS